MCESSPNGGKEVTDPPNGFFNFIVPMKTTPADTYLILWAQRDEKALLAIGINRYLQT